MPSAAPRVTGRRAVGIGARQQEDVDAIEHAVEAAGGELLGHDQQRFGAGRLVAVLGGEDDDGRPARRPVAAPARRRGDGRAAPAG